MVHLTKQVAECTPLSCDKSSSRMLSQDKGATLLLSLPGLHRCWEQLRMLCSNKG